MAVRKTFLAVHVPVILYAGLIFWGSSIPSLPSNLPFTIKDKVLHFIEYFILGLLLLRSIREINRNMSLIPLFGITFLIGIIYAATDEIHQGFVPGRDMNLWDWVADSIGLAAGACFWHLATIKSRKALL